MHVRPTEKNRNHASCRLLAQMRKATTGASPVIELSRYAFSILQEAVRSSTGAVRTVWIRSLGRA